MHHSTNKIYTLDILKKAFNNGWHFNFVFFNHFSEDDVYFNPVTVGCFALDFPCQFEDDFGQEYLSSIQYIMAHKALLFEDQVSFNKIMNCSSPSQMIQLGCHINNFNQSKYNQNSEKIVYQGNFYKFSKNYQLKAFILSFPLNTIFVNADPQNNYWGINMNSTNLRSSNPNKWQGYNKLGFQITKVRDDLLKLNSLIHHPIIHSNVTTEGIYSIKTLQHKWIRGKRFNFVFFWQIGEIHYDNLDPSCFCQWFPCSFKDSCGVTYNCCEQYMMAKKAILFNDKKTLKKILINSDPKVIKKLGREVKNFNTKIWYKECQMIVFKANLLKFSQNEQLKSYMLSFSANTIFVEASPLDAIWGIKLSAENPKASNPMKWKGTNFLGFQLTRVRDYLINS